MPCYTIPILFLLVAFYFYLQVNMKGMAYYKSLMAVRNTEDPSLNHADETYQPLHCLPSLSFPHKQAHLPPLH